MPMTGSNTYPSYTFKCGDCGIEFAVSDSEENIKKTKCTACNGGKVELLYISFPTDGPGYQKNHGYKIDSGDPRACSPKACTACGLDCSKQ